jgi:CBS domain-containing protein
MTSPPVTVPADTTLARAARMMRDLNARCLVVVDGGGRIAGIVTRGDLLEAVSDGSISADFGARSSSRWPPG